MDSLFFMINFSFSFDGKKILFMKKKRKKMKKKKMRHDFSATVLMVKTLLKAFKALTQIHACAHTHPCICECAQKLNALRGK